MESSSLAVSGAAITVQVARHKQLDNDYWGFGTFNSSARETLGKARKLPHYLTLEKQSMVPMEGVEPTHSYEYQILSLENIAKVSSK